MDEPLDLEAIEARILIGSWSSQSLTSMHADALALLAEVKRLRERLAEVEEDRDALFDRLEAADEQAELDAEQRATRLITPIPR